MGRHRLPLSITLGNSTSETKMKISQLNGYHFIATESFEMLPLKVNHYCVVLLPPLHNTLGKAPQHLPRDLTGPPMI